VKEVSFECKSIVCSLSHARLRQSLRLARLVTNVRRCLNLEGQVMKKLDGQLEHRAVTDESSIMN
jgi:hypothetical protein